MIVCIVLFLRVLADLLILFMYSIDLVICYFVSSYDNKIIYIYNTFIIKKFVEPFICIGCIGCIG